MTSVEQEQAAQRGWPLRRFAELAGANGPDAAMDAAAAALLGGTARPSRRSASRSSGRFGADKVWAGDRAGPHGRLDVVDGRYRIVVNREQTWRRQGFTVAHELGHVLLFEALQDDPEALRAVAAAEHWQDVEWLCDRAASGCSCRPAGSPRTSRPSR